MFSELPFATYLFFGSRGGLLRRLGHLECAKYSAPYGASTVLWLAGKRRLPRPVLRLRKRFASAPRALSRGWTLLPGIAGNGFAFCPWPTPERPERVISLWLSPRFTVMTVGRMGLFWLRALAVSSLSRMVPVRDCRWVLAAAIAAVIAGAATAIYTGVLLYRRASSVIAFGTWLVPAPSVSSLSCGVAVVSAPHLC